jgi:hypothetical protein
VSTDRPELCVDSVPPGRREASKPWDPGNKINANWRHPKLYDPLLIKQILDRIAQVRSPKKFSQRS